MTDIYSSKEFAVAWDKLQTSKEDVLRTQLMNPILLAELGKLLGKSVLDAGCGNGFFLEHLHKLDPKSISAFDISPHLVEIAQTRYKFAEYAVADVAKRLPYVDAEFDCVICYNVIMEIKNIDQAIKELARVTKKEGTIHIIIVHPLYNLFVNDLAADSESVLDRLRRYPVEEKIKVGTIPGFAKFEVYRRPISAYINALAENNLVVEKLIEVPISKRVAELDAKYRGRVGIPVFAYFKLKRK